MKKLLTAVLPALALFALGGCAGTSTIASSEDDGVYYSSKDRTTAVARASAPASAAASSTATNSSENEDANPDYRSSTAGTSPARTNGSDQYYDNTYTNMRGASSPSAMYYGPGVGYYAPYSPYTSINYAYGWGGGACGFSPYPCVGYDPFYSPFYSPYGYGYGFGPTVSINFGYGAPFYGGNYGYGNPYAYGRGFYDPYYYASPYYGGYYGRGGYYGNRYGNRGYGNNFGYTADNQRSRTYGRRTDRSTNGRVMATGPTGTSTGGGRVRTNELLDSEPFIKSVVTESVAGGRARGAVVTTTPAGSSAVEVAESYNKPRRMVSAEQAESRDERSRPMNQPIQNTNLDSERMVRDQYRDRTRYAETQGREEYTQPAAQPEDGQRRRRVYTEARPQNAEAVSEQAPEPQRQRNYEQPREQRTYEQPARPQRT